MRALTLGGNPCVRACITEVFEEFIGECAAVAQNGHKRTTWLHGLETGQKLVPNIAESCLINGVKKAAPVGGPCISPVLLFAGAVTIVDAGMCCWASDALLFMRSSFRVSSTKLSLAERTPRRVSETCHLELCHCHLEPAHTKGKA